MAYTMSGDPVDSDSDIDEPVALPLEKSQQRRLQNAVFTELLV